MVQLSGNSWWCGDKGWYRCQVTAVDLQIKDDTAVYNYITVGDLEIKDDTASGNSYRILEAEI